MTRKPRSNESASFFHVITQGINKEYIFKDNEDKDVYMKLLIKYAKEIKVKILAYCIMSNHMHILIYINKIDEMSKMMHKVNLKYSYYYNNKKNRVGYVFRDRYVSEGIYNPIQLYRCVNYIHNNPVKAQIVKNISEYKYSSYSEFVNDAKIIDIDFIRKAMDGVNIKELKCNNNEKFKDIQDNKDLKSLTRYFCKINNIFISELEMDSSLKIKLAKFLIENNQKSIREVSEYIKMNRETLRKKLIKSCQKNRPPDNHSGNFNYKI